MRPLADIQLAVVGRESVGLIRVLQNAQVFPLAAVVSIHRPFVVAGRVDVPVKDRQRLDPLAIRCVAGCPAAATFVAKEPGRSIHRTGIEASAINDHAVDRFGVRQCAAIQPAIVAIVSIDLATEIWILGFGQR